VIRAVNKIQLIKACFSGLQLLPAIHDAGGFQRLLNCNQSFGGFGVQGPGIVEEIVVVQEISGPAI
jgi:hypothetical protein